MTNPITVPYEDYKSLVEDSKDKQNVTQILKTEFPDDTCALIAIKAILGIVEEEEEPDEDTVDDTTDPVEPTDPDPSTP